MAAAKSNSKRMKAGAPKSAGKKRAPAKVKSKAAKPRAKTSKPADKLPAALAEAAWADADAALAEALAEMDAAEAAHDEAAREEALTMLRQALARAARKRGLERIGAVGALEPFDPDRHELGAAVSKAPKNVRIETRGVARGGEMLAKPRVRPARGKKRT